MPPNWHILPVSFNTNQRFTGEYSDTLLAVHSSAILPAADAFQTCVTVITARTFLDW